MWRVLLVLCLAGCGRSRTCTDFELPLMSCGADGFEGTLQLEASRKPTVTADFGCGFEFDGDVARMVPSGQTCMDDLAMGNEVSSFVVHCKLPDGAWSVVLPSGSSQRVKVEKGLMNCAP